MTTQDEIYKKIKSYQKRIFDFDREENDFKPAHYPPKEAAERIRKYLTMEQPEVQNIKFVFPKYLYVRTKDNKTIDVSYVPQDMTAVEYIRNDFVEQEQPEVDFKIEERKWIHNAVDNIFPEDRDFMSEVDFRKILKDTAHHFYELGFNARKEESK